MATRTRSSFRRFGERVFLRADRFRFLGGGGALGPETLAVGGGGLHAGLDGGGLFAGGLKLFFAVRLFAAQAGDLAGEVARVAFQRDDLALERGELDLARLELAARVGQRPGGGLRAGGGVGAGGGGGVDLGLARGDFLFQRADLRLPLEHALPGGFAAGLAAVEEAVAVEQFAAQRGDGPFRVRVAYGAGVGERFDDHAVGEQPVEQRRDGRGRFDHLARPFQPTFAEVGDRPGQRVGRGRRQRTGRGERGAAHLFAGGEGVEQHVGDFRVAQEDRLQVVAEDRLHRRDETRVARRWSPRARR